MLAVIGQGGPHTPRSLSARGASILGVNTLVNKQTIGLFFGILYKKKKLQLCIFLHIIFRMSEKKKKKSLLQSEIAIGGVTLRQKALFAKHLSVMLSSGLTIVEALEISVDSASGKLKKVLSKILDSVNAGNSLSDAMSRHKRIFSGLFMSSVYAGEQSGTLEKNLEHVAAQLEKEQQLISKVRGAMVYPSVVLVAAFILGLAMSFFIFPKIIPLFEGLDVDLPATTRGLIWFSHFMDDYTKEILIGLIVAISGFIWLVKQRWMRPITHWISLHTPVVSRIVRNANLARFCLTLGTLLKSGINIDEALDITSKTMGNFYYGRSLKKTVTRVASGTPLAENLGMYRKLYPIMVTRMVKVGESSGKLEGTLLYLAGFYEIEVDTATKSLSTAIEPMMLIGIGLVVAFLALSIITPIYEITGNVSR
jgi:type IV pilus assembly protein PilC